MAAASNDLVDCGRSPVVPDICPQLHLRVPCQLPTGTTRSWSCHRASATIVYGVQCSRARRLGHADVTRELRATALPEDDAPCMI
jgi:hypothetical protein